MQNYTITYPNGNTVSYNSSTGATGVTHSPTSSASSGGGSSNPLNLPPVSNAFTDAVGLSTPTYNPSTGVYTNASGQGFSTATPPAGATIINTPTTSAIGGGHSHGGGGGGGAAVPTYDAGTGIYTDSSGQGFSTATPPADAVIINSPSTNAVSGGGSTSTGTTIPQQVVTSSAFNAAQLPAATQTPPGGTYTPSLGGATPTLTDAARITERTNYYQDQVNKGIMDITTANNSLKAEIKNITGTTNTNLYDNPLAAFYDPKSGKVIEKSMAPSLAESKGYLPVKVLGTEGSLLIVESKTGLLNPRQQTIKNIIDENPKASVLFGGKPDQMQSAATPTTFLIAREGTPNAKPEPTGQLFPSPPKTSYEIASRQPTTFVSSGEPAKGEIGRFFEPITSGVGSAFVAGGKAADVLSNTIATSPVTQNILSPLYPIGVAQKAVTLFGKGFNAVTDFTGKHIPTSTLMFDMENINNPLTNPFRSSFGIRNEETGKIEPFQAFPSPIKPAPFNEKNAKPLITLTGKETSELTAYAIPYAFPAKVISDIFGIGNTPEQRTSGLAGAALIGAVELGGAMLKARPTEFGINKGELNELAALQAERNFNTRYFELYAKAEKNILSSPAKLGIEGGIEFDFAKAVERLAKFKSEFSYLTPMPTIGGGTASVFDITKATIERGRSSQESLIKDLTNVDRAAERLGVPSPAGRFEVFNPGMGLRVSGGANIFGDANIISLSSQLAQAEGISKESALKQINQAIVTQQDIQFWKPAITPRGTEARIEQLTTEFLRSNTRPKVVGFGETTISREEARSLAVSFVRNEQEQKVRDLTSNIISLNKDLTPGEARDLAVERLEQSLNMGVRNPSAAELLPELYRGPKQRTAGFMVSSKNVESGRTLGFGIQGTVSPKTGNVIGARTFVREGEVNLATGEELTQFTTFKPVRASEQIIHNKLLGDVVVTKDPGLKVWEKQTVATTSSSAKTFTPEELAVYKQFYPEKSLTQLGDLKAINDRVYTAEYYTKLLNGKRLGKQDALKEALGIKLGEVKGIIDVAPIRFGETGGPLGTYAPGKNQIVIDKILTGDYEAVTTGMHELFHNLSKERQLVFPKAVISEIKSSGLFDYYKNIPAYSKLSNQRIAEEAAADVAAFLRSGTSRYSPMINEDFLRTSLSKTNNFVTKELDKVITSYVSKTPVSSPFGLGAGTETIGERIFTYGNKPVEQTRSVAVVKPGMINNGKFDSGSTTETDFGGPFGKAKPTVSNEEKSVIQIALENARGVQPQPVSTITVSRAAPQISLVEHGPQLPRMIPKQSQVVKVNAAVSEVLQPAVTGAAIESLAIPASVVSAKSFLSLEKVQQQQPIILTKSIEILSQQPLLTQQQELVITEPALALVQQPALSLVQQPALTLVERQALVQQPALAVIERQALSLQAPTINIFSTRPATSTPKLMPTKVKPVEDMMIPVQHLKKEETFNPKKKVKAGFEVLVRRRGKFRPAFSYAVSSRAEAIALGSKNVIGTSAATFKVAPARLGKKVIATGVKFNPKAFSETFRAPKNKEANVFVQKKTTRIKSRGEKTEISLQGAKARRRRIAFI